jgi:hypothetical protein
MYHLYKNGEHIMTIDPDVVNAKTADGYQSVLEGYVYSSKVEGALPIVLTYETVYIMPSHGYETEPAATHDELYRLTWEGKTIYTNDAEERDHFVGRGWASTRHPVGYVQSD